jgi:hypothetical protein
MRKQSIFGRTIGACVGALLLVALVAPVTPAGAATALTVTPDTGLVDLQGITISGSGFRPNSVVGACRPCRRDDDQRLRRGLRIDDERADGNFSMLASVQQLMRVPTLGRIVDCRVRRAS